MVAVVQMVVLIDGSGASGSCAGTTECVLKWQLRGVLADRVRVSIRKLALGSGHMLHGKHAILKFESFIGWKCIMNFANVVFL